MKKIVLPFCFIALISIGLLSMNKFPPKFNLSETPNPKKDHTQGNPIRYSDCINLKDVPKVITEKTEVLNIKQDDLYKEINLCLEKYANSLDSTIKNLNTIDAHKFLHSEFQNCQQLINEDSLSVIQVYYHKGIMSICYEHDKGLNNITVGSVMKK